MTTRLVYILRHVTNVHTGSECCAGQLIDSSRERVVLETSRAIDDGRYHAVRLRLCTVDQVSVQLWRRVDSTTYQLHWQMPPLTPTARHTSLSYVTVSHNGLHSKNISNTIFGNFRNVAN